MSSSLKFLITGWRCEAKNLMLKCIIQSESPERVRVVNEMGEDPFVYPVYTVGNKQVQNKYAFLREMPSTVLAAIKGGRGVLMIDCSNEGPSADPRRMDQLHETLRELDLSPRRVVFLSQNRKFSAQLAEWKVKSNTVDVIRSGLYHTFMREMITYVRNVVIPSGEFERRRKDVLSKVGGDSIRPKHFLCLNFTPRMHRIATMLYFVKHGLVEKGLISFSGLQNRKLDYRERVYNEITKIPFPDIESLKEWLPKLVDLGTLHLDTDPMATISPVVNVGEYWYYEQSYFSVVTESGIQSQEFRRCTEKVFKPMLGLHPFMVVGLAHTLSDLRDLGFKTFNNVIDSSYDEIEDSVDRLGVLFKELDRLCDMPLMDVDAIYRKMLPDVVHNYDYFGGDFGKVFVDRIENPLLEQLRAVASGLHDKG